MPTPQKNKPKKRRLWKILGLTVGALVVFLLLFVVAFVFNPFEGSLRDVRDIVPRGVNFFLRKELLAEDFEEFPTPRFWSQVADSRGWMDLQAGPFVQQLRREGIERVLGEARETMQRVATDSRGWIDLLRDAFGTELVIAGYEQDYTKAPPQPLAQPWWCCYTRVTWRVKAVFGMMGFGFVQKQIAESGVEIGSDGDLLTIKAPGQRELLYVKRHLDVVMIANQKLLLEQSQRLIDGNRDEEPLGQQAAYSIGAVKRVEDWAAKNDLYRANAIEFLCEPNAFDGFRRFAASWPNPQNKDSMNERVLASFVNLKGWRLASGALMFADGVLASTGLVELNSKQHTAFQSSFYQKELTPEKREQWLDPFLSMVPDTACACAALRMPVGEFMHAMFDALEQPERDFINDGMKRQTFQGQQVADMKDMIEKLRVAFLPRAGFVFRRNEPDLSRSNDGELMVPVAARSPMPQFAWVFWLRPGGAKTVEDFVTMLRNTYQTFQLKRVWHLSIPFGDSVLAEKVTEFCNPQIPATGEFAMMVFRDFFVVSNSGLLIKSILRTAYKADNLRSIRELDDFREVERELPSELSGFVWLRGENLVHVLDDYNAFASALNELPDQDYLVTNRPAAEDQIRREKYARYPSKASMPQSLTEPGGEFDLAVVALMNEKWRKDRTSFTADDRAQMHQLRAFCQMLKTGYMQVELENNYIRFQAKVLGDLR